MEHFLWWMDALVYPAIINPGRAKIFFLYNFDCIRLKEERHIQDVLTVSKQWSNFYFWVNYHFN